MQRTNAVMRQLEQIALRTPGIKHVSAIGGMSFVLNASGSNFGSMFVNLKNYPNRRDPSLFSDAIANRLREQFAQEVHGAAVAVFGPPPVRGVGRAGGFAIMIEDRGDLGPSTLQAQTENLVRKGLNINHNGQDIVQLKQQAEKKVSGPFSKQSQQPQAALVPEKGPD